MERLTEMKKPTQCQSRQYGDQIICAACGLNWDANDPEPPKCGNVDQRTKQAKAVSKFEEVGKPQTQLRMPYALPVEVAQEMAKVFRANCAANDVHGMQAAYRLFLDRMTT